MSAPAIDWFHQVILPFIVEFFAGLVVVFLGVRSIKEFMRDRERKRSLGDLRKFWLDSGVSKTWHIVFGVERASHSWEVEPRFGYAQAYGVAELINVLERVFEGKCTIHTVPLQRDQPIPATLFEDNVIILGGEFALRAFGSFSRAADVPYYQYASNEPARTRSFRTHPSRAPAEEVVSHLDQRNLIADVGTVTRLLSRRKKTLIVLYNGNYGAGLLAGILATTRPTQFSKTRFNEHHQAQQLLVKVGNIANNLIDSNHDVEPIRDWLQFEQTLGTLDKAIKGAISEQTLVTE